MKPITHQVFLWLALLTSNMMFFVGCGRQAIQHDNGWMSPITVTGTKGGLMGGICVYKCQNTIIVLQGLDDGTARCFLQNLSSNSWSETQFSGVPKGYFGAYPTISNDGRNAFFEQGYMENEQLVMSVLVGSISVAGNVTVRDATEKQWVTDKKTLLGEIGSNATLNPRGKRDWPVLGPGVMSDSDMCIPFCIEALVVTHHGESRVEDSGPINNGVFQSFDAGKTWEMERISATQAFYPSICGSKGYYYYFEESTSNKRGQGFALCFSRKPISRGSWSAPEAVTKTVAYGANINYIVMPVDDTIHVCWMDRRHNKWRFNPEGPPIENDDIAYCHRKDSDSGWSSDVILSKGLLYSYTPSMSVEGNNVVVAWAGIQTAGKWHTDYDPNDIYYVTSKDGGNTWSKPLNVTDCAKDGVTSGNPQVILLKGVIHLFYIQGKRESQELSSGLTKLNQTPWPIYYTQRPFPD